MLSDLGLRSRMAVSYVLVSAAAVLLVEAVLLAVMLPNISAANAQAREAQQRAAQAEQGLGRFKVQAMAGNLAGLVAKAVGQGRADTPGVDDRTLMAAVATRSFGAVTAQKDGAAPDPAQTVQALADRTGHVVTASDKRYPAGTQLPAPALAAGPHDGQTTEQGLTWYWASVPIEISAADVNGGGVIGIAYVEIPDPGPDATIPDLHTRNGTGTAPTSKATAPAAETTVGSLILPGAVVLVLLLPVGALFGLLSTGRLIRRIRRLSEGTSAMTAGDLQARIPVSGGDEVGRLEQAFNTMAERVAVAVDEQRAAAGAEARRAERSRIARELHDSISQELFSVSLVAAGLRKALPAGTTLQAEATSMEESLGRTMREMRALLLELRPIQLEDAGLVAALDELARAYEARLGIRITRHVDPVTLDAHTEHAVLRVVQEAVGNAVRHGEPSVIDLRLVPADGGTALTITDNGRGFDVPAAAVRHGMGLDLMRERIRECGGTIEFDSAPDRGTTVRVWLPAERPAPA